MKKLIIFLLFSSTLFAQDKYFRPTYVFEGKLKNEKTELRIKMNFLILLDSTIVGSYYYNPQNGNLDLAGKLNKDNSFNLSEWFEDKNTGTFTDPVADSWCCPPCITFVLKFIFFCFKQEAIKVILP